MKEYLHPTIKTIHVVEVSKDEVERVDFDVCQQPKETLSHYYERMTEKPAVLINAGLFNPKTGDPCFSLTDDNVSYMNHYGVKDGIGTVKDKQNELLFGNIDDGTDWYDFMAGYPVLVKHGVPISTVSWASELNYDAMRSAMGFNDTSYFFIAVDKPGIKFIPLATALAGLGIQYAINLDGGGSSRLMMNGEVINNPSENRPVDSVCAVYLKKKEPVVVEPEPEEEEKPSRPYTEYTVVYGDSLWKISVKFLKSGSRYKEIVEFNGLKSNTLKVGQVLKIPVDCREYVVVKGDTLWGIASRELGSGSKYTELATFNGIDPKKALSIGQILYIPV